MAKISTKKIETKNGKEDQATVLKNKLEKLKEDNKKLQHEIKILKKQLEDKPNKKIKSPLKLSQTTSKLTPTNEAYESLTPIDE